MIPSELTPHEKRQRVSAAGLAASLVLFAMVVFAFSHAEHRSAPAKGAKPTVVKKAAQSSNTVGQKASGTTSPAQPAASPAPTDVAKVEIVERRPAASPVVKPVVKPAPVPAVAAAPVAKPAATRTVARPRPKPAATSRPTNVPSYAPTVMPKRTKTPDKFVVIEQPPPAAPGQSSPAWYSVRLNSSTNKNLSDAVSTALRQRGFAGSETRTGPDGTYYVKVGDFSFRYAAEETKKQLQELGFTDAHIDEKTVAK